MTPERTPHDGPTGVTRHPWFSRVRVSDLVLWYSLSISAFTGGLVLVMPAFISPIVTPFVTRITAVTAALASILFATRAMRLQGMVPADSAWRQVYVTKPCLTPSDTFDANETGGRVMVLPDRLLLPTVSRPAAQDNAR
jgi:hypothetical protein